MSRWKPALAVVCLLGFISALPLGAQTKQEAQGSGTPQVSAAPQAPPAARPEDVASPDAILAEIYAVISGPAGQKRDWDRFRSLLIPGARLIPTRPKQGEMTPQDKSVAAPAPPKEFVTFVMTPDEFVANGERYFATNSFYEKETARRAERYGNIMQVFSTYESRRDPKDPEPFARGINSFQLFFDGSRWWVVTIYWQQESPEIPLPKEFLPTGK
ncbi:MAG TPA: hypothetical protein VEG64_00420 [Candidatus Sulfotelmatobacter sp.]|nr:hypothetical protein [Candidatus Sulfotelmatobacter sp.]